MAHLIEAIIDKQPVKIIKDSLFDGDYNLTALGRKLRHAISIKQLIEDMR